MKSLRTSDRYQRIKERGHVAVFDRHFCQGAQALEFIEDIDALTDKGRILKSDNTTCVSRISWNGKDVVIKRYNHKGFVHSLRHTIKRSRARRGWLHAHRLGVLNIATPRPLAYIENRKGLLVWKSYLVTEYVEGQKLYVFLRNATVGEKERLSMTRQVVAMLDDLGRYRISHGDLKHTNILTTENGPVLTDLDGMQAHKLYLFYLIKRTKDLQRFLRKTDASQELNEYCRALLLKKADSKKKLTDNFEKMKLHNWVIYVRRGISRSVVEKLVSVGDSYAIGENWFTEVPSSDFNRVFKCDICTNDLGDTVYLKQYLYRSLWDFVKHLFRPSRARRAFKASLMLQRHGFDAPGVIALLERRLGWFCRDNLLAVREVKDSTSFYECIRQFSKDSSKEGLQQKRRLISSFGENVGRMHSNGIFHGDLRLGNVLVVKEGQKWRFFFIDNERTKKFFRLPARLRLKNLVQINMFRPEGITNTDRLMFFKSYLKENPAVAKNRQGWAVKILTRTSSRLQS